MVVFMLVVVVVLIVVFMLMVVVVVGMVVFMFMFMLMLVVVVMVGVQRGGKVPIVPMPSRSVNQQYKRTRTRASGIDAEASQCIRGWMREQRAQ